MGVGVTVTVMVTVQKCQIRFIGLLAATLVIYQVEAVHFVWGPIDCWWKSWDQSSGPSLMIPSLADKAWSPGS